MKLILILLLMSGNIFAQKPITLEFDYFNMARDRFKAAKPAEVDDLFTLSMAPTANGLHGIWKCALFSGKKGSKKMSLEMTRFSFERVNSAMAIDGQNREYILNGHGEFETHGVRMRPSDECASSSKDSGPFPLRLQRTVRVDRNGIIMEIVMFPSQEVQFQKCYENPAIAAGAKQEQAIVRSYEVCNLE